MSDPGAHIKNPGHARVNGGIIYYLHKAPTDQNALRYELRVLEAFLAEWNADLGDSHEAPGPLLPSETRAPPPATHLVVIADNHKSTHPRFSGQGKHISLYVCNDANWALDPHEYGAAVHVFAVNGDPEKGYKEYFTHRHGRQKLRSDAIRDSLAQAEAKDFGTLGQGDLA